MLADLERVQNKRKAARHISTGYDFDPFAEGRKGRDRIQGGRFAEPTRFVLDEENPYFRLPAVNADIDLYTLHARADVVGQPRQRDSSSPSIRVGWQASLTPDSPLDQSEWRNVSSEDAEHAALPRRGNRRLRGRERERFYGGVQAD